MGTQLRNLIELLDGAVDRRYDEAGLSAYRPRYTPVMRALLDAEPLSIKAIAAAAGLTHSAASQTVAQMQKVELVTIAPGADARERIVSLTDRARSIVPELHRLWDATNAAATTLDSELAYPLSLLLEEAIAALERRAFDLRLVDHEDSQ
ncbi:MarR family transcriptional regulator [Stakelama sp. CBK3Z-3]|uniref:MarR family transcriptional regulator n=1 Tax=Stakelama flava TaxID=2860338 RepID=A0ABS6XQ57_9SPHN|nr:MarR family transcriptional regulator [Stakelama flava]MBW4332347.1 MarR family transcriptional regulator [Stakelama flava]